MRDGHNTALLVHPGTQHSRFLAAQLERLGRLSRYWTGFAISRHGIAGSLVDTLPRAIKERLSGRFVSGVPPGKLRTRWLIELDALRKIARVGDPQRVLHERNREFQSLIPQSEIADCDAVIGFDTSSWILAQRAAEEGKRFFLDQSSMHSRGKERLLERARRCHPEWAEDLVPRVARVAEAEEREHQLSHRIVVGSSFSRSTLVENGVSESRIVVNPYGVDLDLFRPATRPKVARPTRFLFVGSVSARKGVPTLLEAWRSLETRDSVLQIAGSIPKRSLRLLSPLKGVQFLDKVPHSRLPALMRSSDVLVLPSFFEGFGMVLLEALATGLPIIASENSAGPDLLAVDQAGIIVPAGDLERLRAAVGKFVESPEIISAMSATARRVAERYTWSAYGDRWADLLDEGC